MSAHHEAEAVREACLRAAREAWEEARMVGLCADGAWEAAMGAIRSLDLDALLSASRVNDPDDRG